MSDCDTALAAVGGNLAVAVVVVAVAVVVAAGTTKTHRASCSSAEPLVMVVSVGVALPVAAVGRLRNVCNAVVIPRNCSGSSSSSARQQHGLEYAFAFVDEPSTDLSRSEIRRGAEVLFFLVVGEGVFQMGREPLFTYVCMRQLLQ